MNESIPLRALPLPDSAPENEAQDLVSAFLTNVSNGLRTPLAALKACVEYLLHDYDALSREEVEVLLQSIHLSITGLGTFIENLIQSATIDAGQFLLRTGAIDLSMVVAEAIQSLQPLFKRRCQQVVVEQHDSLPLVRGDPSRLAQALVNLLFHASMIGPMNEVIKLTLEADDADAVKVRIVNGASRFQSDEWQRLADYFQQPTAASMHLCGEGLAIAVARMIVEEHGGRAGTDWCPGTGLRIWFTVPTVQANRRGCNDHNNDADTKITQR